MKKHARILALILALILCSGVLLSCSGGNESGTPSQTNGSGDSTTAATEAATTVITCDAPKKDYGGYEFRFMGEKKMTDRDYDDLYAEEDTGSAVNDAVHQRNIATEEYFNIKIARIEQGTPQTTLSNAVLAGDDAFDVCFAIVTNMAGNLKSGYLLELGKMQYLDVEKPWWTTSVIDSMEISGKKFVLVGDAITRDKDSTWCLVFNKRLYKDFGLAEPYDMIRSGKWTMDVLQQHCQNVTKDLNGDGTLDWHDQWGLLSSDTAVIGAVTACDIFSTERDKDGGIKFTLNSETNVNKLQRVYDFFNDTKMQLRAQAITGVDSIWTAIKAVFQEGRALYRISIIKDVVDLRNMEDDFGVIPMPKYDENQKDYYIMYQAFNCRTLSVPVTVKDADRTGAVLEYFAYASKDTVREAYYDVTLTGKVARDKDSTDMLDMIFGSLNSDVGLMMEVGNIRNIIVDMMKSTGGNIASTLASKNESINLAIEEAETAIKAIQ